MNIIVSSEIKKNTVGHMVILKDISYCGASFYTNVSFSVGMKLSLMITDKLDLKNAEIVRVDKNKSRGKNTGRNIISVKFAPSEKASLLRLFIDNVGSSGVNARLLHERRRYIRRNCMFPVSVKEVAPKIENTDFTLFENGLICRIDQYFPLFHEIELEIALKDSGQSLLVSGIVISCEKVEGYLYELELFFPFGERDKIRDILNKKD